MKYIIFTTESGSDLPREIIDKWDIKVVPMHVVIDNVDYRDGEFPVDRVFEYYESTRKVPTTSATNVHEYQEFFLNIIRDHPGCFIYHFAYTSKASCTYQNANIALEGFENVCLIDTMSVSGGCTAMIEESIKLIKANMDNLKTIEDCIEFGKEVQKVALRVRCNFVPNTLEYLRAGGRVSNAAYIAGSILSLKPRIEMIDGALVATKKYRGRMIHWTDRFFRDFLEGNKWKKDCLYLMYGKGLPQKVMDRMIALSKEYGFKEYVFVMTGCVISCHGGKGAIGLAGVLE